MIQITCGHDVSNWCTENDPRESSGLEWNRHEVIGVKLLSWCSGATVCTKNPAVWKPIEL